METARVLRLDQPAAYRIVFQGRVEAEWSDWLAQPTVDTQASTPHQPALTTLTGTVADQAALFGLLARLRDLGQPLLLVQCLEAELAPPPSHPGVPHD